MVCCAFAAFLLIQMLAPFRALRRRFFGEPVVGNAAVAWRHGETGPALTATIPRPRGARWISVLALVIAADAVLLGAYLASPNPERHGMTANSDVAEWNALVALHTVWCGELKP